jgi:heme exporter protein A
VVDADSGLEARDLELWRGDRRLFANLSFVVRPGELLHVLGPNGAGKTSLLRVLCGSSPPEQGSVRWNGVPIGQQRLAYHAALAYLGHRDGLKSELSALENVRFALALRERAPPEPAVTATLAELGLAAAAGLPARALSAGQRRRVAIARCLLSGAPLWILDEPFSNLDAEGRAWGASRLAAHAARGGTVVVTSHHPLQLEGCVTRSVDLAA